MDALLAITVVLALMLISIFRKVSLDLTILMGVVLTSLFFGRITDILGDSVDTIMNPGTIALMLLVYLVFFLNNLLASAGAMNRVVESLEGMISDRRIIIAAIPAVIGLMPVLSGAVISAPFADQIGKKTGLSKERRHIVNYWFRHISEYVNPIYPGVLLATGMLGLSFYTFFLANLPIMAFYVAVGGFFLLSGMKDAKEMPKRISLKGLASVVLGVAPILVAVVLPVVFKMELYLSMALAILVAYALNPRPKKGVFIIARESFKTDLLVLVFLVMMFSTVLENTKAAPQISASLVSLGVPVTALLVVLPMLVGFLTGLTLGFVGLTFPILMPFLMESGKASLHAVTLAYVSGYMGLLFSPMHLCFSVTQKYFDSDLRKAYAILLPPLILTFVWTLVYVTFF